MNVAPSQPPNSVALQQAGSETIVARLYGEALHEIPGDLYIPPEALEIFLEAFEGPLDLLLYLIRRQSFNILDIPMAELTAQYLYYIDQIRHNKIELAAEYLLMAAMLIEIKSRMLLPPASKNKGDEDDDPRADLIRHLLEYERIKNAAHQLNEMPKLGYDFFNAFVHIPKNPVRIWPNIEPIDLHNAFMEIIRRAKLTASHTISREVLSVREHMTMILRRLHNIEFIEFYDLFDTVQGVAVVIVHFLALLELMRESFIELTQAEPLAPIYIRAAQAYE